MAQRTKSEIRCASTVATLEGHKKLPFPKDVIASSTLEKLDERVRTLEICFEIHVLPPTTLPTWESLAWRILRLDRKKRGDARFSPPVTKTTLGVLFPYDEDEGEENPTDEEDPTDEDVPTDALEKVASDLTALTAINPLPSPPKLVDEEDRVETIRQKVFYIAGLRRCQISRVPTSKRGLYILAAELAINAEATRVAPFTRRPIAGAHIPPPPRFSPVGTKEKSCCGCCSCYCHPPRHAGVPRGVNIWRRQRGGRRRGGRVRRFLRFGWLKSLACWRKKRVADDSYSSTTSSTIID